jgi:ABC-type Fe3+-hydroxamate transport system substrate-binding protein
VDALGREVRTAHAPSRIVSLVPSETLSVCALGGRSLLCGRTDYCEEPSDVREVPSVGGTKSFDFERVMGLAPDLVLANQEENGERDVRRLIDAGLNVHVSFPTDLRGSVAYLESLATLMHLEPDTSDVVRAARDAEKQRLDVPARATALVLVWREPFMSVDGRTYASDVLRAVGLSNVCAERARRYPLAADLGDRSRTIEPGARDTRYPRLSEDEIRARGPDVVLLPDEPYAFGEPEATELAAMLPSARIVRLSGKWLFWYGARMASSLDALDTLFTRTG